MSTTETPPIPGTSNPELHRRLNNVAQMALDLVTELAEMKTLAELNPTVKAAIAQAEDCASGSLNYLLLIEEVEPLPATPRPGRWTPMNPDGSWDLDADPRCRRD